MIYLVQFMNFLVSMQVVLFLLSNLYRQGCCSQIHLQNTQLLEDKPVEVCKKHCSGKPDEQVMGASTTHSENERHHLKQAEKHEEAHDQIRKRELLCFRVAGDNDNDDPGEHKELLSDEGRGVACLSGRLGSP
ncbi:hypothetical protein B0J15DRAFT_70906 [Fusarium solani]|uniref:Uncharacterized protein n=1 Tax=Fusarium solani TaxID=169388 RepID=A0A9P9H1B0_FUSSL|nr:uncharacterized protein B0J15DRAFT_70906 [Fusarium solani]KAH7248062.1 hypothetical protein B0J15DRAFT_70906 [Fusarium solani]